jgi:hypothetical protein
MESLIAQQAIDSGGVLIPGWAIGLISLGFVLAILPWGSWVTYTLFSLKSDLTLSNSTDKTIFDKLQTMEETIDTNHKETKAEMKEIHGMINQLMRREFRRFRGEGEEKDE